MILALLTTITLTLPVEDVLDNPLPVDNKLIATIYYNGELEPTAVGLGFPGETITIQVPQEYGCWFATAWVVNNPAQSANTAPVCKYQPCGAACHAS